MIHNVIVAGAGMIPFATPGGSETYDLMADPSGGVLSKEHFLGATGVAQCFGLTRQLRGSAGPRQLDGARIGLQHNLGPGCACVVTLYRAR